MFALLSKWPLVRQIRGRKDGTRSERRLPRKWYWKTRARAIAGNSGPAILLATDNKAKQLGKYEGERFGSLAGFCGDSEVN